MTKTKSQYFHISKNAQKDTSIEKTTTMRASLNSWNSGSKDKQFKSILNNLNNKDSISKRIMPIFNKNRPQFNEYYGKEDYGNNSHSRNNSINSRNCSDGNQKSIKSTSIKSGSQNESIKESKSVLSAFLHKNIERLQQKTEHPSTFEKLKPVLKFPECSNSPKPSKLTVFNSILDKIRNVSSYTKGFDLIKNAKQNFVLKNVPKKPTSLTKKTLFPKSEKFKNLISDKMTTEKANSVLRQENTKTKLDALLLNFKNRQNTRANNSDSTRKNKVGEEKEMLIDKEFEEIEKLIFQAKLVN